MWYSIVSEDVKNSLELRLNPVKLASVVVSLSRNLTICRMLNIGQVMTPTLPLVFIVL